MVGLAARPASLAELADAVRSARRLRVVGADGHAAWRTDPPASPEHETSRLELDGLVGIVELEPADQIVVVLAGTRLSELRAALAEAGQAMPWAPFEEGDDPTVGGALSLALPHRLEGRSGSWRDWTLGLTVVRPDGGLAKCGGKVVKNVAGYDVAKLFIGARGTLGVIAQVALRTCPLAALPAPACEALAPSTSEARWVQRVPRSRAGELRGARVDLDTATLWTPLPPEASLPRFEGDWVMRSGCGSANLDPPRHPDLSRRAKLRFDPDEKFNPGATGL